MANKEGNGINLKVKKKTVREWRRRIKSGVKRERLKRNKNIIK